MKANSNECDEGEDVFRDEQIRAAEDESTNNVPEEGTVDENDDEIVSEKIKVADDEDTADCEKPAPVLPDEGLDDEIVSEKIKVM